MAGGAHARAGPIGSCATLLGAETGVCQNDASRVSRCNGEPWTDGNTVRNKKPSNTVRRCLIVMWWDCIFGIA